MSIRSGRDPLRRHGWSFVRGDLSNAMSRGGDEETRRCRHYSDASCTEASRTRERITRAYRFLFPLPVIAHKRSKSCLTFSLIRHAFSLIRCDRGALKSRDFTRYSVYYKLLTYYFGVSLLRLTALCFHERRKDKGKRVCGRRSRGEISNQDPLLLRYATAERARDARERALVRKIIFRKFSRGTRARWSHAHACGSALEYTALEDNEKSGGKIIARAGTGVRAETKVCRHFSSFSAETRCKR